MKLSAFKEDTICALATPLGPSAIGVVRTSGVKSLSILKALCPNISKEIISHKSFVSIAFDKKNEKLDQVLVTYFKDGSSYTGESSFEISCHGNPLILKNILSRIIELGARSAEKGEFTFRAFMNNKIDLVQAESVLSLIESNSEKALKVSLRQLEGELSNQYEIMEAELIWCLAHIEASIDFSTEGLDIIDNDVLVKKLSALKFELDLQIKQFNQGQIIKNGLKVSLIGEPNVGKSSLLNLLVQKEKAIVTNVAGTTRDIIQADIQHQGLLFSFSDTAGLRETTDQVEKIGVAKSLDEAKSSDLNLIILDGSQQLPKKLLQDFFSEDSVFKKQKNIFLVNKSDLINDEQKYSIKSALENEYHNQILFVSTFDQNSRENVFNFILQQFENLSFLDEAIVSSARQIEMIQASSEYIKSVIDEVNQGIGTEFIAQSLKEALLSIQKILGKHYDDQILDRVFKEFCLGK